ncbi:hypothetical protein AYI69_g6176 [Smittium culicis]|uniref:Uncharacterized protein n=1 Tax=Smittium culicis TaxID=133412 RepID=A0A1R1Y1E4_9FUNG|nr:hypothetical protein AYI69_g6176 [Smittium culicis]
MDHRRCPYYCFPVFGFFIKEESVLFTDIEAILSSGGGVYLTAMVLGARKKTSSIDGRASEFSMNKENPVLGILVET